MMPEVSGNEDKSPLSPYVPPGLTYCHPSSFHGFSKSTKKRRYHWHNLLMMGLCYFCHSKYLTFQKALTYPKDEKIGCQRRPYLQMKIRMLLQQGSQPIVRLYHCHPSSFHSFSKGTKNVAIIGVTF